MKIIYTSLLSAVMLILSPELHTLNCCAQSWTQKQSFGGNARRYAVGFSIGTKGYIGTGTNGTLMGIGLMSDFWEWDQATDTWTQKASFGGTARAWATGFSIGKKGYIGTGYRYGMSVIYNQDFWEWDQTTNTWSQKANFGGTGRLGAVGFSIGTKGYIGTGEDYSGYKKDFWEWDQPTDAWTQKADFGGVREFAVGFSIGTKGYIGTGSDGSNYYNDFWEWDQATDTWTQKADFGGTARAWAVGFSIGAKGYIGTGQNGNTNYQDFWEWDQAANTWTQNINFSGGNKNGAVGFSINNYGYIGTGSNGSTFQKYFWEWSNAPLSIENILFSKTINIYPNPAIYDLTALFLVADETKAEIEVFNTAGQRIYYKEAQLSSGENQIKIDISNLAKGNYLFRIILPDKEKVQKVFVK